MCVLFLFAENKEAEKHHRQRTIREFFFVFTYFCQFSDLEPSECQLNAMFSNDSTRKSLYRSHIVSFWMHLIKTFVFRTDYFQSDACLDVTFYHILCMNSHFGIFLKNCGLVSAYFSFHRHATIFDYYIFYIHKNLFIFIFQIFYY